MLLSNHENAIQVGVSYMYEPSFNRALLPLLQDGLVDALEWSFDTVKDYRLLPDWTIQLLKEFSDADRLYGHGVYYSIFAGSWQNRHTSWLQNLEEVLKTFRFRHLSEHFGFMTSGNAHEGAPLPVPLGDNMLALGIHRLKQLSALAGVPTGIENLAFAFSPREVHIQGRFLAQLTAPVNGFVLLDLHNIYCQAVNFGIDARELIAAYPLQSVKEIHISGGSWEDTPYSSQPIRRDTHDEDVPEELFALLEYTLPLCPYVDVVIVERLGHTLHSEAEEEQFRQDFLRVRDISKRAPVQLAGKWPVRTPVPATGYITNAFDQEIQVQQTNILRILKTAPDAQTAQQILLQDTQIDQQLWQIKDWQLSMIETAMLLGKKWGIEY